MCFVPSIKFYFSLSAFGQTKLLDLRNPDKAQQIATIVNIDVVRTYYVQPTSVRKYC